jgi:hypothetical protein
MWTQLNANKFNETPNHNDTKEDSRSPCEGLQVAGKKPLAMLDIFLGICRCRISNVLKHPKLFYM